MTSKNDNIKEALVGNSKKEPSRDRILTGCDLLDIVVGGAPGTFGFVPGTIVNFIGDSSAGKSFVKNEVIAASYHSRGGKKFKWFSDDTETGDTFDTTGLYGFDIMPDDRKILGKPVNHSQTVEEMDAKVGLFLDSLRPGDTGIYAVDSLDGLTDQNKQSRSDKRQKQLEQGKDVESEGTYNLEAHKFLSQDFFKNKHMALDDKNALLIIVSQTREKLDAMAFGQKWRVTADGAMKFYCHTRLLLKGVKQITRADRVVGMVVEATAIKSKTPRPFRKCRFSLYFDYGIDNIGSNLDYLYDLRTPQGELQKTACKSIAWDAQASKTLPNLREWLKENKLDDQARADKREDTGNSNLAVDWVIEWAEKDPERAKKFHAHFGISMGREELIEKMENDPKLQRDLTRRVREKWEAEEQAAASNRKGKYS